MAQLDSQKFLGNVSVDGLLSINGNVVHTQTPQTVVAGTAIAPTTSHVRISLAGDVIMTATPSITTAGHVNGEILYLTNVSAHDLTIQNETALANSGVIVGEDSMPFVIIDPGEIAMFVFSESKWHFMVKSDAGEVPKMTYAQFPAPSTYNKGILIFDTTNSDLRVSDGMAWIVTGGTSIVEHIPRPEAIITGDSTRAGQTNFDGASYLLSMAIRFNTVHFRTTAHGGGAGAMRMLFYQQSAGHAGVTADLVGSITGFTITNTGLQTATLSEGTITLQPGIYYVLWGKEAADSFTVQTYTTAGCNMLTANIPTGLHPVTFTTAVAANTSPSTLNPTSGTATATDVVPILRLHNM